MWYYFSLSIIVSFFLSLSISFTTLMRGFSILFLQAAYSQTYHTQNVFEFDFGRKNNNQRLFYIERSKNRNRIYYDANILDDGKIDSDKPLDVYWINLEERYGQRGELSAIQEAFAYGYTVLANYDNIFLIKLKAYDKREIILKTDKKGKAFCLISINNKISILERIFVNATGDFLSTKVNYIELFGIDYVKGTPTYEKIIPD